MTDLSCSEHSLPEEITVVYGFEGTTVYLIDKNPNVSLHNKWTVVTLHGADRSLQRYGVQMELLLVRSQ